MDCATHLMLGRVPGNLSPVTSGYQLSEKVNPSPSRTSQRMAKEVVVEGDEEIGLVLGKIYEKVI